MIKAYVFIVVKPGGRVNVTPEALMKIKGVNDVTEVSGEYDIILRVDVNELPELNALIKNVRLLGGIEKTTTMIGAE
jgi:DNA-binding Lrp family transcriptional regulator